jgi:hypothetical protein
MGTEPLTPEQARAAGPEPPAANDGSAGRQGVLNLYLSEPRQLFNSMDPAPFRQRDLDPEAAAYIVGWAQEAPKGQTLHLVLHMGRGSTTEADAALLRNSVHEYFRGRALTTRRQLQQLFRVGRYSLFIGLVFLALVIVIGESIASLISRESVVALIQDSLVIGGWVALWRPLEIFLYDWWPISAEAKLFDRLGTMDVRTLDSPLADPAAVEGVAV